MLSDEILRPIYVEAFNKAMHDKNSVADAGLIGLRAVAEAAVKDAVGGRDRDADRQKFSDPAFNRWLDESITENGEFSVWHQLGDVATAWSAWESRPHYERKACDLCDCTGDIHDQTGEWRGECSYCRPQAIAAVPDGYRLEPDDGCRLTSYAEDGSTCTLNLNGQEIYFDRNDHITALAASQPEVK